MADPTNYTPGYSFTDYQEDNPAEPLPAPQLDGELADISASIGSLRSAVMDVRRSDGAVKNNSVGLDQLKAEVNFGINAAAPWVTATVYGVRAAVYQDNSVYVCAVAHTSGTFSTDLAAGRWTLLVDTGQFVDAAAASATAAAGSAALADADRIATAADRIQTGLDRIQTGADASAAASSAAAAAASAAAGMYDGVQDRSADFSIVLADEGDLFRVNTGGGNVIVSLPLISAVGDFKVALAKITGDANVVTINRAGSNTINGSTSYTLDAAYESVTLISKSGGTDWLAIGGGNGASNFQAPDFFNGTGAQTAFTLSRDPGTENAILVFIGGVQQPHTGFSVSGTTLTFSVAPPSGTSNVCVVYLGGVALDVGVPSDGSVTNAKLANMAANTVKANATASPAAPTDVALTASQVFGRGPTGNARGVDFTEIAGANGTYTPTINFNGGNTGITYTSQNGQWVGIGANYRFVMASIVLSNKGSNGGNLRLTLPFTAASGSNYAVSVRVVNLTSTTGGIAGRVTPGTDYVEFIQQGTGASSAVTDANVLNTLTLDVQVLIKI